MDLHHEVEYSHGLAVGLVELMRYRQDGANRLFQALVLGSLVGEPDAVQVMRILKIGHSAEGDIRHSVYIIIYLLLFGAQDADDFEARTVSPDPILQRIS